MALGDCAHACTVLPTDDISVATRHLANLYGMWFAYDFTRRSANLAGDFQRAIEAREAFIEKMELCCELAADPELDLPQNMDIGKYNDFCLISLMSVQADVAAQRGGWFYGSSVEILDLVGYLADEIVRVEHAAEAGIVCAPPFLWMPDISADCMQRCGQHKLDALRELMHGPGMPTALDGKSDTSRKAELEDVRRFLEMRNYKSRLDFDYDPQKHNLPVTDADVAEFMSKDSSIAGTYDDVASATEEMAYLRYLWLNRVLDATWYNYEFRRDVEMSHRRFVSHALRCALLVTNTKLNLGENMDIKHYHERCAAYTRAALTEALHKHHGTQFGHSEGYTRFCHNVEADLQKLEESRRHRRVRPMPYESECRDVLCEAACIRCVDDIVALLQFLQGSGTSPAKAVWLSITRGQ